MPKAGNKLKCDKLVYTGGTVVTRIQCSQYLQPNLSIRYHLPQQPDTNSPALQQHTITDRMRCLMAVVF